MPAFTDLIRAIAGAHRRRNRYTVLYTIGCLCAHWSTSEIAAADTNRTISGMATVVSGDTIEIDGQRIRFHGVDAPEISQTCRTDDGTEWACGKRAFEALMTLTNNKSIRCDVHRTALNTTRVATCHNRRGLDLGAEMISNCLAWAFVKNSNDYLLLENRTMSNGCGIWSGANERPWKYRERHWIQAQKTAPNGCPVKGVISGMGRIYYVPWSPWYPDIHVDETRGEQWFCSEKDAIIAGWRAPRWQ